ncbi:MAG: 3'-5' exonuclease [Actinomycetales bacterium]|nr:3'-5' exonuclease [Actinomycetales bacterium]
MSWLEAPMVGFDTETTGVNPQTDRIVTASLEWINADATRVSGQWIINPGVEIPTSATAVHGITNDRVQAEGAAPAVALEEITVALAEAMRAGFPAVAFNASYDFTILEAENARHGVPTLASRLGGEVAPVVDPLVLDKQVDRYRRGKRVLTIVAEHYGVSLVEAHDAQADARAAVQLVPAIALAHPELAAMSPAELHQAQVRWRAEQQTSLREYFQRSGNDAAAASVSTAWPLEPGH